ncbi:predicted protein [Uncinocarpus reesii 1704]|uniref:YCII-related domain-containing protein n=1 Tax=Uncinocarpus reesii (strain UAMH 1704) TaxID=336963 RepID=C4JSW6_UNCRE|nr:uncharacterized protein UREG_05555 [Uncinocarpus reesii 1704]EEP80713.1 predicted protein [Uncinocarpus reesii 1704]
MSLSPLLAGSCRSAQRHVLRPSSRSLLLPIIPTLRQSTRPSQLPLSAINYNNSNLVSRTMASNAAQKKPEWIVVVPDKAGVTLDKRMSVRQTHIDNLGPAIESGFLKLGGAVLDHHPKEGEAPPMKGSALIVQADSLEEIRETLSKDIYATAGIWDLDNFRCALNVYEKV